VSPARRKRPSVPGRSPFREAALTLLEETGCTVATWRATTSGRAHITDRNWKIEVPEPRGPVSFATFAHEVGHQVLHRNGRRPRWIEEAEAWRYALDQFDRFELPGKDRAEADAHKCMDWTVEKTIRRRAKIGREELETAVLAILGTER
jgi:hypothetical protein